VAAVRHRRDAGQLTVQQLADLRSAVTAAQALQDDRGYQYWAGVHGLPLPISCVHHNHLFLPWHRAYLYLFEKELQDRVAGVTLPWWDWTADQALPSVFAEATLSGGVANALYDSPIQASARRDTADSEVWPVRTFRQPAQNGLRLPTVAQLEAALGNNDFFTFQTQLESLHDSVHMWVGGTMGAIPVAAYDPVFWAHHCMIDRAWYLWQLRHPATNPPATLLDHALPPFPMTVRDTLEISQLGYDYAATTVAAPGPASHPHG
jgi:tyrosinase